MKSSYFLVIPKQQENRHRLRDFETKALQQWIDEIPTANPGLATRIIHDFVIEFNTVSMSTQLRLNALELIKPSVSVIEDYLRDRLIKTGFPKEENHFKILNVLVSIEKELTIGYWMVLKELTRRNISWLQGKNVALAMQRTIKGLSSIIISHFLMGMPIPDWVWIDLHSLYKLSVKTNKDTAKVDSDFFLSGKSSTPEDCYRQILLLSLADPTGLMQKEILLVYYFIETLGSFISFKTEPVAGRTLQCVISTDEDRPPFFESDAEMVSDSSKLYIDFSKLFDDFEDKVKINRSTEGRFSSSYTFLKNNEQPSTELLDYLHQRWQGIELRGAPLFNDRLDRCMTIGLSSTIDLQNTLMPQTVLPPAAEQDHEYLVQSESDSLLSCVYKKTGVLSVGSMVSFRKIDKPENNRLIGIVNKLEVAKQNNKIIFGIELLTAQAFSVTYLQLDATEKDIPQKALFYMSSTPAGGNFIITDNFILKDDDIVRFFFNLENFPIILKEKKNIGLGYWQFTCFRIQEKAAPPPPQKGYDFI